MNNNDRITRLLEKYRNNTLSPEEYAEFLGLMGDPDTFDLIDRVSKEDWKESRRILRDIRADERQPVRRRIAIARLFWGAAASAAIFVTTLLVWPENRAPELLSYQTGFGETRTVVLPDSSKVLLNANSRLVWNTDWLKKKKRELTLEGEGYFDVRKVSGIEFVVRSNHMKISVLGTTFNFRSRKGSAHLFLESGKVNLEIPQLQQQPVALTPGNAALYDSGKKDLRIEAASSLHRSASWVEGMLEFENTPLGDILDRMEELYGKKFKAGDPSVLEKRLDLSLPYSDWDLIRKVLELSLQVKLVEKQDTIFVK
ncbi:FecR domain-containing protein [Ravibacter arvi]|uniref:FecR domain-containing protein n=1 Tax=Ravibacter arvi TaxID=2051041 RepID=A0ABP8M818_9BACT